MPDFSPEALDDAAGLALLRDVLGGVAPSPAPTLAGRFGVASAPAEGAANASPPVRSVKLARFKSGRRVPPLLAAAV
ncbi:hypothetical protein M446_2835 [Methylobacterium sp. 4-46]|uniref:hypothetical protein n=1 Tax=unclassified Methylobacterium TaxID=2615210 RepID=UPI000165C966|nr:MULTISPECIES: hypothetical protein [Methylobacterium]ACA17260.1 hypothetical protein M446_2835 [Methylobacterium sp. 4-46]WFT82946.1 hypothetical protein QA634_14375 [Methylobacterium nodulans]